MDRSAGALSEHLEARSELLLFTRLELAAAQGTVGKLSTSAFRWCRQREPSEVSPAISNGSYGPSRAAICGGHTGHGPNTSYRGPFMRSCSPTISSSWPVSDAFVAVSCELVTISVESSVSLDPTIL